MRGLRPRLGGPRQFLHGLAQRLELFVEKAGEVVEVRERVPISSHEQIKIDEGPVRPPWKPDPLPPGGTRATAGARSWQLTLGAGEKAQLSAQYTVRIPGDQMLVGGNRRV